MSEFIGPLGFWKFPFINKFRGPEFSIKDHKVISGRPDYISNYEIQVTGNSRPWEIEIAYDTKIKVKMYWKWDGEEREATQTLPHSKGERIKITQKRIYDLGLMEGILLIEQIDPR